ncbi:hypothetical protein RRG08_062503 [Elysia crispata]|uniref:Uncharacterized protein n=1 Tax=Elysia crispata TaxID=231223 RepID=A0AAE0ZX70_9GAST|nr:hypothetical protein RRG08_062503 [Elysia crispata]
MKHPVRPDEKVSLVFAALRWGAREERPGDLRGLTERGSNYSLSGQGYPSSPGWRCRLAAIKGHPMVSLAPVWSAELRAEYLTWVTLKCFAGPDQLHPGLSTEHHAWLFSKARSYQALVLG